MDQDQPASNVVSARTSLKLENLRCVPSRYVVKWGGGNIELRVHLRPQAKECLRESSISGSCSKVKCRLALSSTRSSDDSAA